MVYTVLLLILIGIVGLVIRGVYVVSGPTALGDLKRENRELHDEIRELRNQELQIEADADAHLAFLKSIAYDVMGRPDIEAEQYLTEYKSGRKALSSYDR